MTLSKNSTSYPSIADSVLKWLLVAVGGLSIVIMMLITVFIFTESISAFKIIDIERFFFDERWNPTAGEFYMLPMLVGSLLLMAGSIAIAVPLAVLVAVFNNFYAPKVLSVACRRLVEILAGIPSVVYGLWGLVTLVPMIIMIQSPGTSLLAGIIVLAIMIFPTITILIDSAIRSLPKHYIEASVAIGLKRWSTIISVVLPALRKSIFAGSILGAARAIGETMAVLMVCGNVVQLPDSVFEPMRALTSNIALEMAYAMELHRSSLFVSALLLLCIVFVMMFGKEMILRDKNHV